MSKRKERDWMTKFQVIQQISDPDKFAELIFDMINEVDTVDGFKTLIKEELTENQLQTVKSIADKSDYPLSLEGLQ
ncbi:hypothetical protein [Diplocloster agilis]|uniref:Uncharacterized protein n=1 Tax=Diplocloster agilis TaxID=2850323 RepID=A0A949K4F4_9FIRM|nr:hypothetical protein [Diplocloster agilis]MBU9739704.1 hypothetical protein [Diplocloster agilis]